MIRSIIVQKPFEEIQDVLCNKCGKSCEVDRDQFYAANVEYTPGYYSRHFPDDNMTREIDICEGCLFEFLGTCKIPPETY